MNPLVTVIIPGYSQAHTIDLCVRSARAQNCHGIEIIAVDDGSTDDTAAASGATVLRLPGNRGPSAARNLGAAHARGEILFFLDADVALEPGSVAAAVAALPLSPRLGAVQVLASGLLLLALLAAPLPVGDRPYGRGGDARESAGAERFAPRTRRGGAR